MSKPLCFVVMPIGDADDRGDHFRGVYRTIRTAAESAGYETIRADDIKIDAAINRDVVLKIAAADLVIGDLTEGNPNVFYEIGVRHALKRSNTILILDTAKTARIPFDLAAYRVIKYEGTVAGLGKLQDGLTDAITAIDDAGESGGNPVHDWLPDLPADVLSATAGLEEAKLREELMVVRAELDNYQRRYGGKVSEAVVGAPPQQVIARTQAMLQKAQKGLVGPLVLEKLKRMAADNDVEGVLETSLEVFTEEIQIESSSILEMASVSNLLGLSELMTSWLDYGLNLHPDDDGLVQARLARLCMSSIAEERERGRKSILEYLEIDLESMSFGKQTSNLQIQLTTLGFYFDSARRDGLTSEFLPLVERLVEKYPESCRPRMHMARSYGDLGRHEEELAMYQSAVSCPDVNDEAAVWFGNALHNNGYHTEAAEVYTIAAWLDQSDGGGLVHVADEISFALFDSWALRSESVFAPTLDYRPLPPELDVEVAKRAIVFAQSAGSLGQDDMSRIMRLLERCGASVNDLAELTDIEEYGPATYRKFCAQLYEVLGTELTAGIHERAIPTA